MMLALLALGGALRLWLVLRGWPALDSDEAIIGLMGRHILHGARPLFFYGQHYLGALDAYIAAGFFAVLGPTTLALRLSMLPLALGFLACMYWLGRAAFGPAVGMLTLAYLALGPAFGLLRETAAIGGYQETLLLGAALPLLAYARVRQPETAPQGWAGWARALTISALIGVAAGVGLWSDILILPFIVAVLVVLALARWREVRSFASLALALGFVVGCWPFLSYNAQHGWVTLTELAAQNRSVARHGGLLSAVSLWLDQARSTLTVGLAAVLGSPHVCIAHGGIWPSYPPALGTVTRGANEVCGGLNSLFALGVLACLAVVGWQLGRRAWLWWRAASGGRQARGAWSGTLARVAEKIAARRPAGHSLTPVFWLRAMLLLAALGTLAMYTLSRTARVYEFTAARYLLGVYVAMPLVFGTLYEQSRPIWRWLARQMSRGASRSGPHAEGLAARERRGRWDRRGGRWVAAGAIVLLLGFSAVGALVTAHYATDSTWFALPAPASDQRLIATLSAHGISRFVSDYWTCYRLAFESDEHLRCAVRDSVDSTLTRNGAVNRYLPYLIEVERTPHPAYLFAAGSTQDATFDAWAAEQHLAHEGYARFVSEGYAIYWFPGGQG